MTCCRRHLAVDRRPGAAAARLGGDARDRRVAADRQLGDEQVAVDDAGGHRDHLGRRGAALDVRDADAASSAIAGSITYGSGSFCVVELELEPPARRCARATDQRSPAGVMSSPAGVEQIDRLDGGDVLSPSATAADEADRTRSSRQHSSWGRVLETVELPAPGPFDLSALDDRKELLRSVLAGGTDQRPPTRTRYAADGAAGVLRPGAPARIGRADAERDGLPAALESERALVEAATARRRPGCASRAARLAVSARRARCSRNATWAAQPDRALRRRRERDRPSGRLRGRRRRRARGSPPRR